MGLLAVPLLEPQVQILRGERSPFQHGGAHADDHEPHMTSVECCKEQALSGRKREVFHGLGPS